MGSASPSWTVERGPTAGTSTEAKAAQGEAKRAVETKLNARMESFELALRDATANRRAFQGVGENARPRVMTGKNAFWEFANALPARAKAAVTAILVAPVLTTARVARAEPPVLRARRDNHAEKARVMGAMSCRAARVVVPLRRARHLRLRCVAERKAWCAKPATRRWPTDVSTVNAPAAIPALV